MSRHTRWTPDHPDRVTPAQLRAGAETEAADALARVVYDRRLELGLSRSDLADRAGVDEREITRLEDGPHMPGITTLLRLGEILDLSMPMPLSEENDGPLWQYRYRAPHVAS